MNEEACRAWCDSDEVVNGQRVRFDLQCERFAQHDGPHWAVYMGPPPEFAATLWEWETTTV